MKSLSAILLVALLCVTPAAGESVSSLSIKEARSRLAELEPRLTAWNWTAYAGLGIALVGAGIAGSATDAMTEEQLASGEMSPLMLGGVIAVWGGFGLSTGAYVIPIRQRSEARKLRRHIETTLEWRYLTNRYSTDVARAIRNNQVVIGMPRSAVVESWGKPDDINRTVTESTIHEQWVYRRGDYDAVYVYLEDGIVTSFQD